MAYTGSKAQAGRGAQLTIGGQTGGAPVTFAPVGEVDKASFSGANWGTVDVTNFGSGVDDEFITTTRDNGTLDVDGNLVDSDAGQTAFFAAYDAGFKYDFKLQLSPAQGQTVGKLYSFSAIVQSLETAVEVRSKVNFTCKLKISGAVTRTAGS